MPSELVSINVAKTPFYHCESLLASSETFRALVGAATVDDAREHIHWPAADDTPDPVNPGQFLNPLPRAVITLAELSASREGPASWVRQGALDVSIEAIAPAEYLGSYALEAVWFYNQWGAILAELEDRSNQGGNDDITVLNAIAWDVTALPEKCDEHEAPVVYWGVLFTMTWIGV